MFPPRLEAPLVNLLHAARLPMALALLALAAAACAPAAPSQYAQGAPMAPRAPAFSPAEDAPHTVGQPGHMRPGIHLEPNPRPERILPDVKSILAMISDPTKTLVREVLWIH